MSLKEALNDHLTSLNIPRGERARVNAAQHELNQRLRAYDPRGNVRVGGSLSRGTAIWPLKDVDLLLVLSSDRLPSPSSQNPGAVMTRLQAELADALGVTVKQQNRSLAVVWQGIDFDLVPCWVENALKPDELRLPDLGRSRWLRTCPACHEVLIEKADRAAGQLLRPLIRGVKAWRRHVHLPLQAFHLEAMSWTCLDAPPHGLADGLHLLFARLSERVKGGFSDPAGKSAQVDERLSDQDRRRASELLRAAAADALRLPEAQDPVRAVAALLGPRPR